MLASNEWDVGGLAESALLAVDNATHHAMFFMDENGVILSWNIGAEKIFGFTAAEVIGTSASILYTSEDVASGRHREEMDTALGMGYAEDDRWHVRKDGTRFWSSGIMTPATGKDGNFRAFLKIARDRTSAKIASERALYLAQHDSLTGLPNRSMFNEQLNEALSQAKLSQTIVQVFLIDLDRFKEINDSYGHHIGDLFLKQVAKRLTSIVRASDLVARLGGDEFGIICQTADGTADTQTLASKLVKKLALPYFLEDLEIQSGGSVGASVYPLDSKDAAQTLKNADVAMYAAKTAGRSRYQLYTEALDADARRRDTVANWLREVIDSDGLMLHYQPLYRLSSRKVTSIEALLRWEDCPVPDISSEEIIHTATETGLIKALGEWVLRTACNQAKSWRERGWDDFRIAVNVSSSELNALPFLKLVDDVLTETQLPPECLELEITEHVLMEDNQSNDLLFRSLKKKGVYLTVDDFGTGFSSLSSLKTFPVDGLKIDREFIRELPYNEHDAAITSAIVGLAHSLDLRVSAEGIEREEQVQFLTSLGCDCGQGFFCGMPAPAEEIWQRQRE